LAGESGFMPLNPYITKSHPPYEAMPPPQNIAAENSKQENQACPVTSGRARLRECFRMTHQSAEKMKVFIVSNKTRIDIQLTPEERAQYKKFSDEYDADLAAKRAARDEPHQEPVNNVVALKSKDN
jgi:hypothetical protein